MPYTPARHFPKDRSDPGFATKPQIAAALARRATDAGVHFRAVAADCAYGGQDGFRSELATAGLPFVMALKRRRGTWAYGPDAHTPQDAARKLAWHGPDRPGDWTAVTRTFHNGHTTAWWAADASLGWWKPDGTTRLMVATTDPNTPPEKSTWYPATNLPRPGPPHEADTVHPAADPAEIVRINGIRNWIKQSYKQVKDELGWAHFQVRTNRAIRHQTLVNCAFSFCWEAGLPPDSRQLAGPAREGAPDRTTRHAGPRPYAPSAVG